MGKADLYPQILKEFKNYMIYERQCASSTMIGYGVYLSQFLEFLNKEAKECTEKDVHEFLKYMQIKGLKETSVSNYIIALRAFYNWMAYSHKTTHLNDLSFYLTKIVKIKRNKPVVEVPKTHELEQLRRTLHAYKKAYEFNKKSYFYKIVLRDIAIIEMLIASGARSNELRKVRLCDISLEQGEVCIQVGKGGTQRVSIFGDRAKEALAEHLEHNYFNANDYIFVVKNGNMLNYIIKRWAKRANINEKIHSHSFRHYHVTETQRRGVPTQVVADQVGHVNLNTTRNYTHFDINHRRDKYKGCEL